MARIGDDEGQPVDLAALAREVRWAWLIVNAAIPMTVPGETMPGEVSVSLGDRVTDRISIRTAAFTQVLRELRKYELQVRPEDAGELIDGRMPEGIWPS
jgi:hypothetical protein